MAILFVTVFLTVILVSSNFLLAEKRKIASSADLVALAAVEALTGFISGSACETALLVAEQNGVQLLSCVVEGLEAEVEVSKQVNGFFLRSKARAGFVSDLVSFDFG